MIVRSLRLRLILAAMLWTAIALAAAGLVIAALLREFIESRFDSDLTAAMVAVMAAGEFDETGRFVVARPPTDPRFDQPLSGWYWQVADAERILARSRSLWDADLGIGAGEPDGSVSVGEDAGPDGMALRIMRRNFTAPGGTERLRVAVAMPAGEIEDEVGAIVRLLAASLALLGLGIALAVAIQVHFGLKPLADLSRRLAEVRRGDRLALPDERYAEIAPLVREMNALIEHNRTIIERARTHVGNLAHALKTPLSVLGVEAARVGRDPEGIAGDCVAQMDRLISHHLRRARTAATRDIIGARTPLRPVLDDLALAFSKSAQTRGIAMEIMCGEDAVFAGERQDAEEMLGNLIDNACKWAVSLVKVDVRREGGSLVVEVADDGAGIAADAVGRVLDRGVRLDESKPGSGLGLPIVQELASLYGGALDLADGATGGLRAILRLPSAETARA